MTQRILHEHTIRAGEYIIFTFMRYDSILMKVASVWHNCYTKKKLRDGLRTKWINRISLGGICTSVSGLLRCETWQESVVRTFKIIRNHQEPHAMVILESFKSFLRLA